MARKRTIRPEEKALWKKVARSVTPLSADRMEQLDKDEPVQPAPEPTPDETPIRTRLPRPHKPQEAAIHHPPVPHDRSTEKRVRRGRVDIDARIDLHGLTQAQALSSLRHFIAMAYAGGYRTVLVITGKGLKARERESEPWDYPDEPGVLRRKLPEWLGLPEFRQQVSGCAPAHVRHGGSGAYYVTLRVRPKE
ncbi:MAG: Smr/MutS family protein [Alphaproteobacteria bacterium]|uniref:Smr/MutS family protein n=1 Tax=Maricaulis alexandrii TaxID=2570354 RepID=UPI001107CF0D|nr:Smr/MutS family protein [Maricaulis alexandrii]MCR9265932.1 Smr/MutS family protein [Alphaproteobacteria bacterium]